MFWKHLLRLLTDSILLLVSVIGVAGLFIFFISYSFLRHFIFNVGSVETRMRLMGEYLHRLALSLDQTGNVLGFPFLNDTMIHRDDVYLFGDEDKTISYAMAVNARSDNLTWFGIFWLNVLEIVDEDHMNKALVNNEGENTQLFSVQKYLYFK